MRYFLIFFVASILGFSVTSCGDSRDGTSSSLPSTISTDIDDN